MGFKTFKIGALCALFPLSVFSQLSENTDSLYLLDQRVSLVEDAVASTKKLKISGYLQAQWESTQSEGTLRVGESRNALTEPGNINRFGIRRGRLKTTYEDFGCLGVFELDINDKSITLKDVFLKVLDPWTNVFSLYGGVFNRPFGYEIPYSTGNLETPERSRFINTLLTDERDLGTMLAIQAPKTSGWNPLKLEAGLFAGNGINRDNDSKKDFIGHLSYVNSIGDLKFGIGSSMYYGFVAQQTKKVFSMNSGSAFTVDSTATNKGAFANRIYYGVDGQLAFASVLGITNIRSEYIFGQQPGASDASRSPNGSSYTNMSDTYIRNFTGGYIQFLQDIGTTKHTLLVKYDWYDPNAKIAKDELGLAGTFTGKGDIAFSTLAFGYHYRMNKNVRFSANYDINTNETTSNLSGYKADKKDNTLTIRIQYKF